MGSYGLHKKCLTCQRKLLNKNKSGYCNTHRDRTGKNNPFYGKKHSKKTIDAAKIRCRQISKDLWKDETYRNKVIKAVSKPRIVSFKQEQSIRITQWYKDNPEQKIIRRKSMKRNWANGVITKNNFSCNESNLEKNFMNDLRDYTQLHIIRKTLHDGKRWFFPDMMQKGCGVLIEFYGDFWHANPKQYKPKQIVRKNTTAQQIWDKDEKTITTLQNLGYDVIIVWESDYKENKNWVLSNINNYINWDSCSF